MRPFLSFAAVLTLAAPGVAQVQPNPVQRIDRLERQVRQVQARVFPRGQPVETAGTLDDPAASQTVVVALSNRIDNLERQLNEISRTLSENAGRVAALETTLADLRGEQERRLRALETGGSRPAATAPTQVPPRAAEPVTSVLTKPVVSDFTAEGETAYDVGFRLWQQKKYSEAVASLRAMASSFAGHRRVSWANNLGGRALLDSGEPRAAAEALLANYRGNPRGERAADSLFYLGQALVALKQTAQACKAYSELDAVYGTKMRDELKALLPAARAKAGCK